MIKDYLKENQPLFYRIIENEFNLKKIPHAFLLVGNNTDQPLQFLTMSLICNETLACEQCIDCQKVLNHQYADIIEIDGEEESIKKKHIENIQETFKKSSLEGKAKVYILKNVEKTTKEAMNALLKILEEPTEGIYAIFTTKNINRILPTIISRCQVIELKPDNKEVLKEKLIAKGYEEEKASVLSYIIKDEDDLENLNQDNFDDIMLQAINFVEDLFLYRENLIINTQIHMLKDHKEKENIKLFINLIILALKDMFHVKQNEKDICELAELAGDERVLEVGPGCGTLTLALLQEAACVTSIEADPELEPVLDAHAADYANFRFIMGDALKVGPEQIEQAAGGEPTVFVANLPYNVAATIILQFFQTMPALKRAVVMVQKEVADRIAAVPGNKTYGGYTAKLGLYAQVTGRFEVPPRCFMPAPHVDSAVVRIDRVDGVVPEGLDREFVARVIDAAFAQRRKTIRNSMSANGFAKDVLDAAFEACGIAPTTRAETLGVADFVCLARELSHDA